MVLKDHEHGGYAQQLADQKIKYVQVSTLKVSFINFLHLATIFIK
jgi:hypothetical protein